MIILRVERLNETAGRCRAEGARHQSVAVAYLERSSFVVPLGYKAEMYLPDPVKGTAQTKTYQGRQTKF
jgi:hypothetical protein